jgi:hypothetical protein
MIVVSGGLSAFNGLVYGLHSDEDINYFRHQQSTIPAMIGPYGEMFMNTAKSRFDEFHGSEAIQKAKIALQHVAQAQNLDGVRSLFDVVDFQTALPVMQRWVMACPEIREVYHKQQCDGYSETYVDSDPGKIGDNHYDYRRVMNGIVHEVDGIEVAHIYSEDLRPGDTDLIIHEQKIILSTWDIARLMFKKGYDDLTNQTGGKL